MQSRLNPYISFRGNAREAMEFYRSVFGGKLELHTFEEFGAPGDPAEAKLVMHSMLEAENGITFMGSDTPASMPYEPGSRISMALSGDDHAELSGYFEKLSAGGQVAQPLSAAPWGDTFGMCVDRYGVTWMINISAPRRET